MKTYNDAINDCLAILRKTRDNNDVIELAIEELVSLSKVNVKYIAPAVVPENLFEDIVPQFTVFNNMNEITNDLPFGLYYYIDSAEGQEDLIRSEITKKLNAMQYAGVRYALSNEIIARSLALIHQDQVASKGVNPIVYKPGLGIRIWGNKLSNGIVISDFIMLVLIIRSIFRLCKFQPCDNGTFYKLVQELNDLRNGELFYKLHSHAVSFGYDDSLRCFYLYFQASMNTAKELVCYILAPTSKKENVEDFINLHPFYWNPAYVEMLNSLFPSFSMEEAVDEVESL